MDILIALAFFVAMAVLILGAAYAAWRFWKLLLRTFIEWVKSI